MIEGKGFFIWKIQECENGDVARIAQTAHQAGLTHVLVKIANGIYDYNYDPVTKKDLVAPLATELAKFGIQTWGWHYVFGNLPYEEARAAIRQINKLPLAGYIIDAEGEYKNRPAAATTFMNHLRDALPYFPMGLSSYRFPRLHMEFPWTEFLARCDFNMPQVYWEQANNPGEQLARSYNEFQSFVTPIRPYLPAGSAYAVSGWAATSAHILEFMNKALELGFSGVNFWSWDYCRSKLPHLWTTISQFQWPSPPQPADSIPERLLSFMNGKDIQGIIASYQPGAVHINSARTIQGIAAIQSWYSILLNQSYLNSTFQLITQEVSPINAHFSWKVIGPDHGQLTFTDTVGIENQKIIYHYTTCQG